MLGIGFFEAMADLADTDPLYLALTAGMMVIRIAADVLEGKLTPAQMQYTRARRAIGEMRDLPQMAALRALLDAAAPDAAWNPHGRAFLCGQLMAYGIRLHEGAHFRPAVDVFDLAATATDDDDVKLQAIHREAWAQRLLANFDEAERLYESLEHLAEGWNAGRMQFQAQIGLARVLLDRGNVPAAESALLDVARAAEIAEDREIFANAMISLARIAGLRGQPREVLRRSYRAFPYATLRDDRERLLINMAMALRELGEHESAVWAAQYTAEIAQNSEPRAHAKIILLNLAVDREDHLAASALCGDLRLMPMTPVIAAEFYEALSRKHATSGRYGDAVATARRMLSVAEEHRLSEHILRADKAIHDLERNVVPAIYAFRPKSLETEEEQDVISIQRGLRMLCSA